MHDLFIRAVQSEGIYVKEYLVWWHRDLQGAKRMIPSRRISLGSCDFSFPLILHSLWVSSNKQRVGVNYLNRKAWWCCAWHPSEKKRWQLSEVALNWPFDWQMAVWVRADLWLCWRVYPVIITMSSVKQRHSKASDPERQAINQYSAHTATKVLEFKVL